MIDCSFEQLTFPTYSFTKLWKRIALWRTCLVFWLKLLACAFVLLMGDRISLKSNWNALKLRLIAKKNDKRVLLMKKYVPDIQKLQRSP